jgi:phosphatidylglycerophosphate synthase
LTETGKSMTGEEPGGFKSKPPAEFFHYFGKDRPLQLWLQEKRTRLARSVFPFFSSMGLVPDTISYVGISFLAGVILYFVRNPPVAVVFLAGHVLCDGLDGAYARDSGKASQSGAFTDLVCDQFGMVVVAIMAIFHHLVSPLLGSVYVALYLIVVVFGVIINVMGLGTRVTITSKYLLYIGYGIWAGWGVNLFSPIMSVFSLIMAAEVSVGYFRLKRGIRKKYDSEIRFTEGDPYSGKLNYALNVAVPVTVILTILVGANFIPIRSMLDTPRLRVPWEEGIRVLDENSGDRILGLAAKDKDLLILVHDRAGNKFIKRVAPETGEVGASFPVPEYVSPAFSSLPVDRNVLLLADGSTRLLMGIDLDASFEGRRMVTVLSLPMGYLHLTAMAAMEWKGQKVWLAANYLYTRKTYVIDPKKALKKGSILEGVAASYVNGAFPTGMTAYDHVVIELNSSPFRSMIYVASLKRMIEGKTLLDASRISFAPPVPDALGPVLHEDRLVMVSQDGRAYRLPVKDFLHSVRPAPGENKPADNP